jgi:hypothetical protein
VFALVITLVVFVSTAVLIYQYWSGSLLPDEGDTAEAPAPPETLGAARDAAPLMDHAA